MLLHQLEDLTGTQEGEKWSNHNEDKSTWPGELESGGFGNVRYTPINDKYLNTVCTQTDMAATDLPPIDQPAYVPDVPELDNDFDVPMPSQSPRPATTASKKSKFNNYYQRMAQSSDVYSQLRRPRFDPGPPTFRSGRLGAPWRHIRQCTGNLGNHICFVDGVVKQDDMNRFPPFGYIRQPPEEFLHLPPPFLSANKKQALGSRVPIYQNPFQKHAKEGFKYWQEEKVPMAEQVLPKRTIQGRLMRLGVGH